MQLTDQNPNLVETMDFPRTAEDIKNQLLIPAKMKQNTEHLEFNISEKRLIHFDDKGKEVESWPARTGNLSGKVSMEKNRGPLPPGEYLLGGKPRPKDDKAFCDQERDCWSQTLDANFETERELLAIHPDGGDAGTAGCIGKEKKRDSGIRFFWVLFFVPSFLQISWQIP
ncbi:MAG: hypothetical protein HYU99_11605 [Deltaproteobacteria bacterium]|nr:hypothetical protein [Deltaproteobacteria bacterium]